MTSSHDHSHHNFVNEHSLGKGRLLLVVLFNLAITIAEIVGGLFAGSLSLVSDALHNLRRHGTFHRVQLRFAENIADTKK